MKPGDRVSTEHGPGQVVAVGRGNGKISVELDTPLPPAPGRAPSRLDRYVTVAAADVTIEGALF